MLTLHDAPFLTECRIPQSYHTRRMNPFPFQYRHESFQIIRIIRSEYGGNQTFVSEIETEHSVVGYKFPACGMKPYVIADISGESFFSLSPHT